MPPSQRRKRNATTTRRTRRPRKRRLTAEEREFISDSDESDAWSDGTYHDDDSSASEEEEIEIEVTSARLRPRRAIDELAGDGDDDEEEEEEYQQSVEDEEDEEEADKEIIEIDDSDSDSDSDADGHDESDEVQPEFKNGDSADKIDNTNQSRLKNRLRPSSSRRQQANFKKTEAPLSSDSSDSDSDETDNDGLQDTDDDEPSNHKKSDMKRMHKKNKDLRVREALHQRSKERASMERLLHTNSNGRTKNKQSNNVKKRRASIFDDSDDDSQGLSHKNSRPLLEDSDDETNSQRECQSASKRSTSHDDSDSEEHEFDDGDGEEEPFRPAKRTITRNSNNTTTKKPRSNYIYCCPVCFVESYRRLNLSIRPEEAVEDDEDPVDIHEEGCFDDLEFSEFDFEPVEILRCVDPSLQLASAFCFHKLAEVKHHLKQDHAIHAQQDVTKNDVFHRFHLNQADGLVQRYLKRKHNMQGLGYTHNYFKDVQEEMKTLNRRMERSSLWREQLEQNGRATSGEQQQFENTISIFWNTFSVRGTRIWKGLQQAYCREDGTTSSDEDDDESVESGGVEDAINHDLLDRQQVDLEEEQAEDRAFIEDLRRRHNLPNYEEEEVEDGLVDMDSEEEDREEEIDEEVPSARNWGAFLFPSGDEGDDDDRPSATNTTDNHDSDDELPVVTPSPHLKRLRRRPSVLADDDDD